MPQNLTLEFCQFALSTEDVQLSSSCPVSGFFTHDSMRGYILYSAQVLLKVLKKRLDTQTVIYYLLFLGYYLQSHH
jgi:hypothetical protein